jgi:hypothetical protein
MFLMLFLLCFTFSAFLLHFLSLHLLFSYASKCYANNLFFILLPITMPVDIGTGAIALYLYVRAL